MRASGLHGLGCPQFQFYRIFCMFWSSVSSEIILGKICCVIWAIIRVLSFHTRCASGPCKTTKRPCHMWHQTKVQAQILSYINVVVNQIVNSPVPNTQLSFRFCSSSALVVRFFSTYMRNAWSVRKTTLQCIRKYTHDMRLIQYKMVYDCCSLTLLKWNSINVKRPWKYIQ